MVPFVNNDEKKDVVVVVVDVVDEGLFVSVVSVAVNENGLTVPSEIDEVAVVPAVVFDENKVEDAGGLVVVVVVVVGGGAVVVDVGTSGLKPENPVNPVNAGLLFDDELSVFEPPSIGNGFRVANGFKLKNKTKQKRILIFQIYFLDFKTL